MWTASGAYAAETSASNTDRPARPRDTAGLWSGVLTGTFQGQPFLEIYAVTFDREGQVGNGTNDSSVRTGPLAWGENAVVVVDIEPDVSS